MSDRSEGYDQGRADANAHIIRLEVEIERLRAASQDEILALRQEIREQKTKVAWLKAVLRAILAETTVSDEAEILRGIAAQALAVEGK